MGGLELNNGNCHCPIYIRHYETYQEILNSGDYQLFCHDLHELYGEYLAKQVSNSIEKGDLSEVLHWNEMSFTQLSANDVADLAKLFNGQSSFLHLAIDKLSKSEVSHYIHKIPAEYRLHYLNLEDEHGVTVYQLIEKKGVSIAEYEVEVLGESPYHLINDTYVFELIESSTQNENGKEYCSYGRFFWRNRPVTTKDQSSPAHGTQQASEFDYKMSVGG
jgi:hypothetical protein